MTDSKSEHRTTVDWDDLFSRLSTMDGDEWDTEHERLKELWTAAYSEAFVSTAVSRGWKWEDAETWPTGIGDEAFIETYRYRYDPQRSAEADVIACEEPL